MTIGRRPDMPFTITCAATTLSQCCLQTDIRRRTAEAYVLRYAY